MRCGSRSASCCSRRVGESTFELWLARLEVIAVDPDGSLVIDAPAGDQSVGSDSVRSAAWALCGTGQSRRALRPRTASALALAQPPGGVPAAPARDQNLVGSDSCARRAEESARGRRDASERIASRAWLMVYRRVVGLSCGTYPVTGGQPRRSSSTAGLTGSPNGPSSAASTPREREASCWLFAPVLPDASSSRVTVSRRAPSGERLPGAPAANVSEATRPAGGENQGMVEGHGIAAPYHRTVTVPIKSSHAQPETSSRAGRSLSVTDRVH